ncbi:MAG: hypothetical protein ABR499_21675 [Gemmatimonadaceae bacterium]
MSEESIRDRTRVSWRVHLSAAPVAVYQLLSTASGRSRFWAESAEEQDGVVEFRFSNGATWLGRVLARDPPRCFVVEYIGGSRVAFDCAADGGGGTDLTLTETGLSPADWEENNAGWVSVLLALKAAVDFGIDLRNHDPSRSWDTGFVDN